MSYIGCTKKFLKELKDHPKHEPVFQDGFQAWHANLYWFYRRKCVLLTNDSTRFCILLTGLTKPDFISFGSVFLDRLENELTWLDGPESQVDRAMSLMGDIQFGKSQSRSVLGTMNDLAYCLQPYLVELGRLPANEMEQRWLSQKINRIPCQTKFSQGRMFFPADEMRKLLATLT